RSPHHPPLRPGPAQPRPRPRLRHLGRPGSPPRPHARPLNPHAGHRVPLSPTARRVRRRQPNHLCHPRVVQTATWRFPLAGGFNRSRTCRVVSFTILGITLTGAGACLGYALGLLVTGQDSINATAPLASVLAAALAALAVASSGLVIAFVSRAGAWLEGPFLTVRRLGARTVNLAAARSVAVTATRGGPLTPDTPLAEGMTRTPVLIIGDGDQTVRLR